MQSPPVFRSGCIADPLGARIAWKTGRPSRRDMPRVERSPRQSPRRSQGHPYSRRRNACTQTTVHRRTRSSLDPYPYRSSYVPIKEQVGLLTSSTASSQSNQGLRGGQPVRSQVEGKSRVADPEPTLSARLGPCPSGNQSARVLEGGWLEGRSPTWAHHSSLESKIAAHSREAEGRSVLRMFVRPTPVRLMMEIAQSGQAREGS